MKITRLLQSLCLGIFVSATALAQTSSPAGASASNQDEEMLRHLSPNASVIYHVNLSSFVGRKDWSSMVNNLSALAKSNDQTIISTLSDPSNIGIDTHRDIFISKIEGAADSPKYTIVLVPLSDSGKFIHFFKEQNKSINFTIRPGKIRTAYESKNTSYAWNDKLAVITFIKVPAEPVTAAPKKGAHAPVHPSWRLESIHKSIAALQGFPNSPIAADAWFKKGLEDGANAHMWTRGSFYNSMMKGLHSAPIPGMNQYLAAASQRTVTNKQTTMGSLFFENGNITFKTRTSYTPDWLQVAKSFGNHPLNEELISRLPQGKLLGFAALHVNPQDFAAALDKADGRHKLDSSLTALQLSLDDITKSIKGDIMVAAITPDKPSQAAGDTSAPAKPEVDFYFVIALNDASEFNKVADKLKLFQQDSTAVNEDGTPKKSKIFHTIKDNILVLGKTQALTDSYFAGPGRGASDLVDKSIRENPLGIAIDFRAVLGLMSAPGSQQTMKTMQATMFLSKLRSMSITVGKMEGDDLESQIQIKMANADQNSLTTLMQLFNPGGSSDPAN